MISGFRRILQVSILAVAAATASAAVAQDDSDAQANNPLANMTSFNLQNQFNELARSDAHANAFLLRYAKPFTALGGNWVMRATLPVNTFPDRRGDYDTGLGDLNVFAAYLIDTGNPALSFGIGPQITMPTASEDSLGSGKWSLGLANVLFNASSPKLQYGYLLTWQASVAGDDDRSDINVAAFQPFIFYQLGQGWYLRSTGVWNYDFETDYYSIPVGLGVGKVTKMDRAVVNAFIEPQWTVERKGEGQPDWGVFAGVNFQY